MALRSDLDFVCATQAAPPGLLASTGRTLAGTGIFFVAPQGYTQTLAHTGMEQLLDANGYFVEFGQNDSAPSFVNLGSPVWRWRLKRVLQPSEALQIYASQSPLAWIQQATQASAPTTVLAENVFLLVALPERAANDPGAPLSPNYAYNSRDANQPATYNCLPVRVRLALGAIDSISAERLAARFGLAAPPLTPANLFNNSAQFDADLATLDQSLTAQKIGHRFFQRTIQLPAAPLALLSSP